MSGLPTTGAWATSAVAGLHLHPLTPAHAAQVGALEARSHAAPWTVGMLEAELRRTDGLQLGASTPDGRIVGMLLAAPIGDSWHLLDIAVCPERRRRGVARWLLEVLHERVAAGIGTPQDITLEVRAAGAGAIALYLRCGYVEVGRRRRYYPDGETALVMQRAADRVVTS